MVTLRSSLGETIETETIASGGLWSTLVDVAHFENALLNLSVNARDAAVLDAEERRKLRENRAKPICDALHEWMVAQRKLVSAGSAIAKALVTVLNDGKR
jgi:hypothetical protein